MKRKTTKPKFIKALAAVLISLGSLSANAGTSTSLPGLMNPAEVLYPETLIPTVKAESLTDAAYMNGYLHAKDRLFQMDYTRRLASGTVSELVGAAGLSADIQLRTLGFRRSALRSYKTASEEVKAMLLAYSSGVNAYVEQNGLPIEYSGLEISQFKQWQPLDSIAVAKLIAFELSNDLQEIDWTIAIGTFQQVGALAGFDGTALFMEDLYRSAPPDDRVTVPGFLESIGGVVLQDSNRSAETMNSESFKQYTIAEVNLAKQVSNTWHSNPSLKKIMNDGSKDKGSNVWAVSGKHTESGFPLVANDPHLSLDYPSVFYPIHLSVDREGYNVAGVGFPGAPIIAQGCNSTLCWGSTVHPVDETDFFFDTIETNLFGLPSYTIHNGVKEQVHWIFQVFYANQIGDGVMDNLENQHVGYDAGGITFVVPRRNNGPILSLDSDNSRAITMQYTGFSATQEIQAFLNMSRADDIYEFKDAMTYFDVGSQNFGVADIYGNIAYYTGAEVPVREDLQTMMAPDGGVPPMFIRDGTGTLKHEWMSVSNPQANQSTPHEILSSAEMPQWENPDQGWFGNANNDPIGVSLDNNVLNQIRPAGGLYYLSQGGYSSYRMGRLDRIMQAAISEGPVNAETMKSFQANNQLMDAELILPHVMTAFSRASDDSAWPGIQQFLGDPRVLASMDLFLSWDYSTPTGIAEGYDFGDNPFVLGAPSEREISNSVAATIYSTWRSMMIKNTIDATIQGADQLIGQDVLSPHLPGSKYSFNGMKNLLDNFSTNQGYGASGINFFTNPEAPTREDARDFVILGSLVQALNLLASDEFAPAFSNSTDIMDYRWGKLHRIVFEHPLGPSLSVPNGLFGFSTVDGLSGIPRAGGYQVLDASSHSTRADGLDEFMFSSGPARRFVATMTDRGPAAEQIIPGGQSGVITTGASYVNQLFFWLVNAYLPLIVDVNVVDAIAVVTELYEPGN